MSKVSLRAVNEKQSTGTAHELTSFFMNLGIDSGAPVELYL